MTNEQEQALCTICEADRTIGLFYLFGSQASGDVGPMSDYDMAVYFDPAAKVDLVEKQLTLIPKLTHILGTNAVDLVILNKPLAPELKYSIIRDGKILFEREPHRVVFEPRAMNEYFDFRTGLLRFGLTAKDHVQ